MASKRDKLLSRMRESTRTPNPDRLRESEAQALDPYLTMGVGLFASDVTWLDQVLAILKKNRTVPRANRSLLLQVLVRQNRASLESKTPEEVARFFKDQLSK